MVVREAKIEEVESIVRLMKGMEQETAHVKVDVEYATNKYIRMINSGIAHMVVLESDDGNMVGGLGFVVGPDLHCPRTIAVETYWYVDPEHRGDGMLLLRYLETWAKDNRCDAIAMIHLADSSPDSLEKVYRRRGYIKVESHYVKEVQQ